MSIFNCRNIAILGIGRQKRSLLSFLKTRHNDIPKFTQKIEKNTELCLIFYDYPLNYSNKYIKEAKYKNYVKVWPSDYNQESKDNLVFIIRNSETNWPKWFKDNFNFLI